MGRGCPIIILVESELADYQVGGDAGTDSWVDRTAIIDNALVSFCNKETTLAYFNDGALLPLHHVGAISKLGVWCSFAASTSYSIDTHYRGEAYGVDLAWYGDTPSGRLDDVE